MKVTSLGDVTNAVVTALKANVSYPVSHGPFTKRPGRGVVSPFVAIGSEEPYIDEGQPPVNSGTMQQQWKGLGQSSRDEQLQIPCCAIGKSATNVADAYSLAESAMQDVFDRLGRNPTPETYNALVSDISNVDVRPAAGGAIVTIHFTLSASARLV